MSEHLPKNWIRVLNFLVEAPEALRSPAEIGAAVGLDEEDASDLLCDLDLDGWLTVWETDEGPMVTLSALGAERLGVRIVEFGNDETPRWVSTTDPEPWPPRARDVCHDERAATLGFVEDPLIPPDLAAERAEACEAFDVARPRQVLAKPAGDTKIEAAPRPSMLLGLGLAAWPGPNGQAGAKCPACGDRTLRRHVYCLVCDRWGFDADLNLPDPLDRASIESRKVEYVKSPRNAATLDLFHANRKARLKARIAAERKAQRARRSRTKGPKVNPASPRETAPIAPRGNPQGC